MRAPRHGSPASGQLRTPPGHLIPPHRPRAVGARGTRTQPASLPPPPRPTLGVQLGAPSKLPPRWQQGPGGGGPAGGPACGAGSAEGPARAGADGLCPRPRPARRRGPGRGWARLPGEAGAEEPGRPARPPPPPPPGRTEQLLKDPAGRWAAGSSRGQGGSRRGKLRIKRKRKHAESRRRAGPRRRWRRPGRRARGGRVPRAGCA